MNTSLAMQGSEPGRDKALATDRIPPFRVFRLGGFSSSGLATGSGKSARAERDFLVDNPGQKSYALRKHKKLIYLLAPPFDLPRDRGPKRGFSVR
jgi:hypothetical protein